MWTSEALAFVVDEALQVYGGYGYSKEFPAERAYRDARITRIYEGTNEINRLIIPTRLLKNCGDYRHLFTGENAQNHNSTTRSVLSFPARRVFSAERDLLARAKRLVTFTLGRATSCVRRSAAERTGSAGPYRRHHRSRFTRLESALLRTEKLVAARGEHDCAMPIDITRVYASDAADRMEHSARQVVAAPGREATRPIPFSKGCGG